MFLSVSIPLIAKIIFILVIGGFMPLSAMTFLTVMKRKKKKEFEKALKEMSISSKRNVEDVYSAGNFFLPVTFVTLICLLAVTYFSFADGFAGGMKDNLWLAGPFFGGTDAAGQPINNTGIIAQSMGVLAMAFMGGFLWAAQNIIVRLIANDIAPNVYYSAGIRIILASVIALILSFIIGSESGNDNVFSFRSSLGAISFITGMFPERVLTYLINLYKRFFSPDKLNEEILSLYHIEGMSLQHRERLAEVSIDNAQNLATASLTKLLLETPFGARQLIDWIGQAKLICYAKDQVGTLREVGIRSVFDFVKVPQTKESLSEIAESAKMSYPFLQIIYDQITNDRGIRALYSFMSGVNTPNAESKEEQTTTESPKKPT